LNDSTTDKEIILEPADTSRLANLMGQLDEHIKQISKRLDVKISNRGHHFRVHGSDANVLAATTIIHHLYKETASCELSPEFVHLFLNEAGIEVLMEEGAESQVSIPMVKTRRSMIKLRGKNQQQYVKAIQNNDINFGIGPAGTGKTYLAVACAVQALEKEEIRRILLVRPAVEAGEKLGFLPGDLSQKIDPYLRPLYDALYEMLGFDVVGKLIERNVIEVAPLAYMRGRTLNNSFIILDESQNTTKEQMKMFLTRIGFGSTAVITGDVTQIDLPRGVQSGLTHVSKILDGVEGITFTHFGSRDVVRHPLVQRVVEAYDKFEQEETLVSHQPDRNLKKS